MTGRHRGGRAPFRLAALVLPAPRPAGMAERIAELEERIADQAEILAEYGRAFAIVDGAPPEPPRPRLRVIRGGAA